MLTGPARRHRRPSRPAGSSRRPARAAGEPSCSVPRPGTAHGVQPGVPVLDGAGRARPQLAAGQRGRCRAARRRAVARRRRWPRPGRQHDPGQRVPHHPARPGARRQVPAGPRRPSGRSRRARRPASGPACRSGARGSSAGGPAADHVTGPAQRRGPRGEQAGQAAAGHPAASARAPARAEPAPRRDQRRRRSRAPRRTARRGDLAASSAAVRPADDQHQPAEQERQPTSVQRASATCWPCCRSTRRTGPGTACTARSPWVDACASATTAPGASTHPVPGQVRTPAQVDVVAQQRQRGVEAAQLVPDVAPHQHAGGRHGQHVACGGRAGPGRARCRPHRCPAGRPGRRSARPRPAGSGRPSRPAWRPTTPTDDDAPAAASSRSSAARLGGAVVVQQPDPAHVVQVGRAARVLDGAAAPRRRSRSCGAPVSTCAGAQRGAQQVAGEPSVEPVSTATTDVRRTGLLAQRLEGARQPRRTVVGHQDRQDATHRAALPPAG